MRCRALTTRGALPFWEAVPAFSTIVPSLRNGVCINANRATLRFAIEDRTLAIQAARIMKPLRKILDRP
jgi:hypothetical protein